jgi:parallel beta-helix repeat protein
MGKQLINTGKGNQTVNTNNVWDRIVGVESSLAQIAKVNPLTSLFSNLTLVSGSDYKFTGDITLTTQKTFSNLQNVNLDFGKGKIQWASTTGTAPSYNGSTWVYSTQSAIVFDGLSDCVITNLEFIQDKTNLNIKTWQGIVLKNCTNVEISDCLIDGFNWSGIVIEATCKDCKVVKNKVYRCRFGIFDLGVNTLLEYNDVSNKYSESQEYVNNGNTWLPATSTYDSRYYDGIMAYGTNSKYRYNRCYDNGQSGIYSGRNTNCEIAGNTVENNFNAGIDMGVTDGTNKIMDVVIALNTVRYNKNNDINITGVASSHIIDNKVVSNVEGRFGIILTGASSKNTISGNKVKHDGVDVSSRGISVASSCQNNKVMLNDVEAPTPYSIGGNNKLFTESPSFKDMLTVDLQSKSGYDGRAILKLLSSIDNTYVQILANQEVRITDEAGNAQKVRLGEALFTGNTTFAGTLAVINSATKFKLGATPSAPTEEGYLWYDSTAKKIKYSDASGTIKTITAT